MCEIWVAYGCSFPPGIVREGKTILLSFPTLENMV